LAQLRSAFELVPDPAERGGAPAETWLVPEHSGGKVGVIASVSRPFCGACDRTRLTADGAVRSCLFSQEEIDLRGVLRAGASDDDLAELWRKAMWAKPAGHGIDDPKFLQPARPMSAIGGWAMLLVRYCAGARAAAGTPEEKVSAATLGGLIDAVSRDRPRLASVLPACAFLVDGLAWRDRTAPLPTTGTVDVLPPFAGG